MGFGANICDEHDNFVAALFSCLWASPASFVGEAKALVKGLVLAVELDGPTIIVESDSQVLMLTVNNWVDDLNNFGLILADIWNLFQLANFLSFKHVRRNCNSVAICWGISAFQFLLA